MMKKKVLLVVCAALALCLLAGCTVMPVSTLDTMFRGTSSAPAGEGDVGDSGDTVTISRERYERYRQFDELLELEDAVDTYYYKEPDHEKMVQGAAAGLLAGLGDHYTFYYTPEDWTKMWEDEEGEYAGIGILISSNYKTGLCTISRVFKGSPAEAAGVHRGDILYRVGEDLYVVPDTVQDAVDVMRGTPGTPVEVTFLRGGEEMTYTLNRAIITVNQVESTVLEDGIGYIAVYQFAGEVDKEFEKALTGLIDQGVTDVIIDLRDNPGGWVDDSQNIADQFLDEGDVCYLLYRDGHEEHVYRTKDGKVDIKHVVLLVNENSASSAEILTGALRDRMGATVVGVKTYGKGIVQLVMPVGKNGAGFQITTAEYRTPNGTAVHEVGLTPDVEIPLEEGDNGMYDFADTEKDPQLKKALEVMREKRKEK